MKHDADKVRLDLIEPEFITGLGQALTYGIHEYGEDDWKNLEDGIRRFYAAAFRHTVAIRRGERFDPDSKIPHVYFATANLMFIDYLYKRNPHEAFINLCRPRPKSNL